jgi:putative copper export protein
MASPRRAPAVVLCLLAAACAYQGVASASPLNSTAQLPSAASFKGHTSGATYLPLLVLLVVPGVAVLQLRVDQARVLLARRREKLQLRKAAGTQHAAGAASLTSSESRDGGDTVAVAVTERVA